MISKEDAKEKLKELIDTFSLANKNKDYISGFTEGDIANQFIDPLLYDVLGWKRQDVRKEVNIHKKRADYVLSIGNESKLVLEAKKATVPLMEPEGIQAVSYAYNKKIKFAILTNFKEIKVYHALSRIKTIDNNLIKFEDKSLFRIPYDKLLENFERLWLLSRESLEKNELSKYIPASVERAYVPIDEHLSEDLLFIRKELSSNLKSLRTELEDLQIDEAVQIFIDRFIFMRSVEDRGLEDKDFLLKIREDYVQRRTDKNLWELLKKEFQRFDEVYNSKLFSSGLLEKEGSFADELLKKIIKIFYYGREDNLLRYEFNEIPGDLLGNVYEQYLGTILQGTEKRVKLDEGSGKRKKMGIYYTPTYIVDYIVRNTIGEYIKDKTIDEILEVNVVDPACGSGSFLVRAFHELCQNIESKFAKGEKSLKYKTTFQGINKKLNFSEKAQVLKNCIYGVDLDEKAVELAHLNLVLAVLEGETSQLINRKLPRMDENLKNGNSLIDDSSVAGDKAFKWEAQFSDVFRNGGFDIVVGNPPYIFARSSKFSDKEKKYYYGKYILQGYQLNTYGLFIEKAYFLLRNKGSLGFIIPNNWLTINTFKDFRNFIINNSSDSQIINIYDQVFSEANVDTCVLIFNKDKPNNISLFEMENSKIKSIGSFPYGEFKDKIINISSLKNKDNYSNLNKIEFNSIALGKIAKVSTGLKTYQIGKGKPKQTEEMKIKRIFHSDKKLNNEFYPYLEGRDVGRYTLSWSGEYLKYGNFLAEPRKSVPFKGERILVRQIPSKLPHCINAVFTNEEVLHDINSMVIFDSKPEYPLKLILGIVNSKLISYWFANKFGKLQRGLFPQFKVGELAIFPIRKEINTKQIKGLVCLVDEMLALQKKLHQSKPTGNEKERLEQQIKNVDYEIDQEVYKLYGLTKEEIKIVEESLK